MISDVFLFSFILLLIEAEEEEHLFLDSPRLLQFSNKKLNSEKTLLLF